MFYFFQLLTKTDFYYSSLQTSITHHFKLETVIKQITLLLLLDNQIMLRPRDLYLDCKQHFYELSGIFSNIFYTLITNLLFLNSN